MYIDSFSLSLYLLQLKSVPYQGIVLRLKRYLPLERNIQMNPDSLYMIQYDWYATSS